MEADVVDLVLGELPAGIRVAARRHAQGWGLRIEGAGIASGETQQPVVIELYTAGDAGHQRLAAAYQAVERSGAGFTATAAVHGPAGATFHVRDVWEVRDGILTVDRSVTVQRAEGAARDTPAAPDVGFLSALLLQFPGATAWTDAQAFAPGMLYGHGTHVRDVAIGGTAHYREGVRQVRIREDRLPAPLFGLRFADGSSAALLHEAPEGDTTAADSLDVESTEAQIDERFRFASLGGAEEEGRVTLGVWFPGTEGETTYRGDIFPGGQLRQWRRRYHPVRDGVTQQYRVSLRFRERESFAALATESWRWAWTTLAPQVAVQDIGAAREALVSMLADRVRYVPDDAAPNGPMAGIPLALNILTGEPPTAARLRAVMGFCGRNTDSAYYLLREAARQDGAVAERFRRLGTDILETFVRLRMAPPEAEGFRLDDGTLTASQFREMKHGTIHLRALAEGCKAMLRAWRLEREAGRDHAHWLRWCVDFGDWLLTQQDAGGAFPRAWEAGTGAIGEESLRSTHNAVAFFVLLSECTRERRYLEAAQRAGDFSWESGHKDGEFVGGTLDNPDVVDKEAGTLSLEAYLALYEATREQKWLDRGRAAGDFAETWIYCWNVPIPADDDPARLHWKPGATTVGLQLIATGHTLVDQYMAWDVASYAKLWKYTGDAHYLEVARILLHNTKTMLAVPGRTFDLIGPGWQQEHWSLAPRRGYGMHRLWLPWVSCSHLEGIALLEDFDRPLFEQLASNAEVAGAEAGTGVVEAGPVRAAR